MSVLAARVRERSLKWVLGGADPARVRAALDVAASAVEALERDIDLLRQQHADALGQIDRIGELERSLLRSCVAAEEDARIRCGAARRYATRVVAAAQEQAAARLEAPARERDALMREIDAITARRQQAAAALEALIAGLEHAAEANHGFGAADEKTDSSVLSRARTGGTITAPADSEFAELTASGRAPGPAPAARTLPPEIDLSSAGLNQATAVESVEPDDEQPQWGDADLSPAGIDMGASDRGGASIIDRATVTRPEHARPRRPARVRVPIAAGSAAALLLVLQGSTGAPRVSGPPAAIAAASFAPAPSDPLPGPTPDSAPGGTGTAPASAEPDHTPAAAALTMRIKPLRKCWVRVVVDDRTDARELQPTEDIVLQAQRSIVLRVGDAGALSVEVNGRVLPPLGLDGQVVERRFTAGPAAK